MQLLVEALVRYCRKCLAGFENFSLKLVAHQRGGTLGAA
jgi:hypothetical protein